MKPSNIACNRRFLASILMLGWALAPQLASAGMPSGLWKVHVSNPTNLVWDASLISELQSPEVEFSEDEVTVSFDAPFTQTGAGKLTGSGDTTFDVDSDILLGAVPGTYVAKGSIHSAKGIAKLTFASSVSGTAMIEGRARTVSSSFAVKVAVNSVMQSTTGTYTSKAAAAGYGSLKETGEVDFPWGDVVAAMGDGRWTLHLNLTNDAVKKVGGTANVVISGGRTLGFTVKGNYKAKTDSTLLILSADAESKGSSLKVTVGGSGSAVLQGKLTGQAVKTAGTLDPE